MRFRRSPRTPFHGGASDVDRKLEEFLDQRSGFRRKLSLIHAGRPFLRRDGIDLRWFGIYLHHLDAPDPGMDMHDHPWWYVSFVVRGGYMEVTNQTRTACWLQDRVDSGNISPGFTSHQRWSIHTMPLWMAHRIVDVEPDTVTLVIRGPKVRRWGFYTPDGYCDQEFYDYATRRPVSEVRT